MERRPPLKMIAIRVQTGVLLSIPPGNRSQWIREAMATRAKMERERKNSREPAPKSRTEVGEAIVKMWREAGGQEANDYYHGATEEVGGRATTFYKKLPGEVKSFLEGRKELRQYFTIVDDPEKSGGEDAMQHMGDQYWSMLESFAQRKSRGKGSALEIALEWARKPSNPDPQARLLVWIYDNTTLRKDRLETARPAEMPAGSTLELDGHKFTIEESSDGYKILQDGADFDPLPAEFIEAMPADRGSKEVAESVPF